MQDIESDLEEDISPSTYVFHVIIPTSTLPVVSKTLSTRNPFEDMIPQHTFYDINLYEIIFATNGTLAVSLPMPISTPFSTLPILSASF